MGNENKYASEYPLPGGVEQYFDTLVELLRYIRDNSVTLDDLSKWMFATFPNASGQIAVNGYIATLNRHGLWLEQQDGQIRLSPDGTTIVTKIDSAPADARRLVMEIKYRDFLGYDVLFEMLANSTHSLDEIHRHLKEALAVDWKSRNQSAFRVNWLRILGYAQKEGKEYRLTKEGSSAFELLNGKSPPTSTGKFDPQPSSVAGVNTSLVQRASELADRLDRLARAGGDGKEFEEATEAAFEFLGFDTQLISGSGNPDVLATATMGEKTYRILIDSKSRTSGVVQQNDVNFLVLDKQRQSASADFTVIVGADFAGGQLEEFAIKHHVRLLSTDDVRQLLLAHAESVLPLDALRPIFLGGGATNEGVLTEILSNAESKADVLALARSVFAAVKEFQDKAGAIHADSLFYILKCEHLIATIKLTLDFLKSDLIGALGETERGSLFTRISPATLMRKLAQITRSMDLVEKASY
jgi:hypothetical protein